MRVAGVVWNLMHIHAMSNRASHTQGQIACSPAAKRPVHVQRQLLAQTKTAAVRQGLQSHDLQQQPTAPARRGRPAEAACQKKEKVKGKKRKGQSRRT